MKHSKYGDEVFKTSRHLLHLRIANHAPVRSTIKHIDAVHGDTLCKHTVENELCVVFTEKVIDLIVCMIEEIMIEPTAL